LHGFHFSQQVCHHFFRRLFYFRGMTLQLHNAIFNPIHPTSDTYPGFA
jgi:hypothetical protein